MTSKEANEATHCLNVGRIGWGAGDGLIGRHPRRRNGRAAQPTGFQGQSCA